MVVVLPEEIRKLKKIFEPYCKGIVLDKDAPEEAKKAYKEYFEYDDGGENEQ
jgi:hypothetical protein